MGARLSCLVASVSPHALNFSEDDSCEGLLHVLNQNPAILSRPITGLGILLGGGAQTWIHVACEEQRLQVVQCMFGFLASSDLKTVREALKPYCRRVGIPLPGSVREGLRMAAGMCNAKGQTPLMLACAAGASNLVKLLLSQGANVWAVDLCCLTALHYAAISGCASCVATLMRSIPPHKLTRSGARYINARCLRGFTPLHYAVYHVRGDALRELLRHDPDINAATSIADCCVFYCTEDDANWSTCDPHSTPLHLAAARGNETAIVELLRHFACREGTRRHVGIVPDPRLPRTLSGRQAWQLAATQYPAIGHIVLAALHPTQPLSYILGRSPAPSSSGAAETAPAARTGPPSLAALAAAALQQKLLASVAAVDAAETAERRMAEAGAAARRLLPPISACRTVGGGSRRAATVTGFNSCTEASRSASGALETLRPHCCTAPRGHAAVLRLPSQNPPLTPLSLSSQASSPAYMPSSPMPDSSTLASEPHPFGVQDQHHQQQQQLQSLTAYDSSFSAPRAELATPFKGYVFDGRSDALLASGSGSATAPAGSIQPQRQRPRESLLLPSINNNGTSCCLLGHSSGPATTVAASTSFSVSGSGGSRMRTRSATHLSSSVSRGFLPPLAPCTSSVMLACNHARPASRGGFGGGGGSSSGALSPRRPRSPRNPCMVGLSDDSQEDEEEGTCSVCFERPVNAAPATCRHGLCTVCAGELCRAVATRPLLCPFCRRPVTEFLRVAVLRPQQQWK